MTVERLLGTRAQKFFILTVVLQGIAVLALVALTFRFIDEHMSLSKDARSRTVPCYFALFALAEIFELAMAFDALRLRNIIQLVGILLFHMALIVMSALQIGQTRTSLVINEDCGGTWNYITCGGSGTLWAKVRPLLIAVPCVIGLSWFALLFFVKPLYQEFGWAIFHVVGANPQMKQMYQFYQVMVCLLKFDFFFFVGVTMQLLIIVLTNDRAEFIVTIIAIPVVLVLLIACGYALSREVKWLMTFSLILMLAAMSYFLYKLVRFFQPASREQYITTRGSLATFTIVAFTLLFASFAVGMKCFADFDRGLQQSKVNDVPVRPKLYTANSAGDSKHHSSYMGGVPMAQRISIE